MTASLAPPFVIQYQQTTAKVQRSRYVDLLQLEALRFSRPSFYEIPNDRVAQSLAQHHPCCKFEQCLLRRRPNWVNVRPRWQLSVVGIWMNHPVGSGVFRKHYEMWKHLRAKRIHQLATAYSSKDVRFVIIPET